MEPFSLDNAGEAAKLGLNIAFMTWVLIEKKHGAAEAEAGSCSLILPCGIPTDN